MPNTSVHAVNDLDFGGIDDLAPCLSCHPSAPWNRKQKEIAPSEFPGYRRSKNCQANQYLSPNTCPQMPPPNAINQSLSPTPSSKSIPVPKCPQMPSPNAINQSLSPTLPINQSLSPTLPNTPQHRPNTAQHPSGGSARTHVKNSGHRDRHDRRVGECRSESFIGAERCVMHSLPIDLTAFNGLAVQR